MPTLVYAGVETPDNASVTVGGVHYRCYVWRDDARQSVWADIYVEQEAGQEVLLLREELYVSIDAPGSHNTPDTPKVVSALGSCFVCQYVDYDGDPPELTNLALHRSTIDMAAFDSTPNWTYRGTAGINYSLLHDIQPIEGDTDYVVVRAEGNNIVTARFDGLQWADTTWSQTYAAGGAPTDILTCYAHDGDNIAMWFTRLFSTNLAIQTLNLTTGVIDFTEIGSTFGSLNDARYTQGGFCRYAASDYALVCECQEVFGGGYLIVPAVDMVRVDEQGAEATDAHRTYHLRLLSRPWTYAGAREAMQEPNVYALVGYSHNYAPNEHESRNGFVVNLAAREWDNFYSGGSNMIRPRICSNLVLGTLDTQASGRDSPAVDPIPSLAVSRRTNHISNASLPAPYGPYRATRTISPRGYSKLLSMSSSGNDSPLQPVGASVLSVVAHIEEPWTVRRDDLDPSPTPSAEQQLVPYPWSVGETEETGKHLFIGGGAPAVFDGYQLVENGFPWPPEILDVSDPGVGDEALSNGDTYQYVATYEWRDNQGSLHRSAPSPVASHTYDLGTVEVDVSTMTISQRDNLHWYPDANPIEIVIWRAGSDGIFRRVYASTNDFQIEDTPVNDPTTWRVQISDAVSDSDIASHEILPYQLLTGGGWTPLPPYIPPALSCITKHQNRIWGASAEDPRLLYYSQELLPEPGGVNTLPPEWNPSLVFRVDEVGQITALQPMDNALIVFCDRGIYSVTGFGADSTGGSPSLQLSTLATGIGCIEPRSVVLTPIGIFFQSRKGLYLLGRTQGLEYIDFGANVEDVISAGGNIRAATLLEDRHEVRFVTNTAPSGESDPGDPLVVIYDYLHDNWSTAPLPQGDLPGGSDWMSTTAGGTEWRGNARDTLHVVLQQGALLVEREDGDSNEWTDEDRTALDPVLLDVETEWIHLDGIAGFKRLKNIGVVLDKPSDAPIRVQVWYDISGEYDDSLTETFNFTGAAPAYLRLKPRYQKCTAFRLRIYEQDSDAPSTENVRITGVHAEVAIKKGIRRG